MLSMTTKREMDFESTYDWLGKPVKLVPLFAIDKYMAQQDELMWVYSVDSPNDSFHVPQRLLK